MMTDLTSTIVRRTGMTLLCAVALLSRATAQTDSLSVDSLSIDMAVQRALQYHPSLKSADASVRSAHGAYRQAIAGYLPSLNFTGTGARTEGAFVFNPSFPPRDQGYNSYALGFGLQVPLIDFGKTGGHVSASDNLLDAATQDLSATREDVIVNVEIAYFSLLQAEQVAKVSEEAKAQSEKHLQLARAFYSVGRRPQFDVTKAEVDVANANVNLISARNQMRIRRVQLENAMGIHTDGPYRLISSFGLPATEMTLDSARAVALRERPELRSTRARVEADYSLAHAARAQHLPTVSAYGTYTWTNFTITPLYNRWIAGLSFTLPIFQGFALNAQVEEADANVDVAQASLDLLTQNVLADVEQEYLSLQEAADRIEATAKLTEQAQQSLTLAERQYAAGVSTLLEVTDAQLARSNAQITAIQALFDYNVSLVRLRRSIGMTGT
jgi:TolC family type I secretion outer membrane protein